jgi:hypothetical protein
MGGIANMQPNSGMSRREILERLCSVLAAAAWARWSEVTTRGADVFSSGVKTPVPTITATGTAKTHFFTPEEKDLVATVADLIIPTDQVSAGARTAGVQEWIDFVVANSPDRVQKQWREGLATLDRLALESSGKKFQELTHENQAKLLEELAKHEFAPTTPGERFFALAKEATVNGYYTSEIGLRKDLRYVGGVFVASPDSECHGGKQKAQGAVGSRR